MKNLIKLWKRIADGHAPPPTATTERRHSEDSSNRLESSQSNIANSPDEDSHQKEEEVSNTGNGMIQPLSLTGDSYRDKCRELIAKSLRSNFPEILHSICNRNACRLEQALYEAHSADGTNMKKYKMQFMSKLSNLKDKKNPDLREGFIHGSISADDLAVMSPADMASDELTAKNKKFQDENLKDCQMSVNQGTATEMFTCGKCKSKKCTYTQLQTRSSDEPMTTFVFCMNCGNRWKFC